MPRYGCICDSCGNEDEIVCGAKDYSDDKFPLCDCGTRARMRRLWDGGGRIAFRSKGRFGFVTKNMDGTPQRVDDYQDLQRKLKQHGLHLAENNADMDYRMKHIREIPPHTPGRKT